MPESPVIPLPKSARSSLGIWVVISALALVILAVLVLVFAAPKGRGEELRSFVIPSSAMEPTVMQGDRIIADMGYYRSRVPRDGDMVLYKKDGTIFIKRIIASGGERIRGSGGSVYVNDKLLSERYAQHTGNAPSYLNEFDPVLVPGDSYFVMGDNRDVSLDSRTPEYGFVTADSVVGKPLRVIFNPHSGRFGKLLK